MRKHFHAGAWQNAVDITMPQLAGSGVNVLNPRYARFEELTLPPILTLQASYLPFSAFLSETCPFIFVSKLSRSCLTVS